MQCISDVSSEPSAQATPGLGRQVSTIASRIWLPEHDWLHAVFLSRDNTAPKFRHPDLLSACVELALQGGGARPAVVEFLQKVLTRRDPHTARRSCDVWSPQFELLLAAHREDWNRFPNPRYDLDQVATACVALVRARSGEDGSAVLAQARVNVSLRCASEQRLAS